MELQPLQDAMRLGGRESLVERAGRVGGQVVLHHPDAPGIGVVHVDEFAQSLSVVPRRALLGHRYLAPRPVRVDGHVHRAVATILVLRHVSLGRLQLGAYLGWASMRKGAVCRLLADFVAEVR